MGNGQSIQSIDAEIEKIDQQIGVLKGRREQLLEKKKQPSLTSPKSPRSPKKSPGLAVAEQDDSNNEEQAAPEEPEGTGVPARGGKKRRKKTKKHRKKHMKKTGKK